MTFIEKKSKVTQVLDEISLDYATGSYLNVISSNYGMERPAIGFSDDEWRAVSKLVQLQEKTTSNKIRKVLEVTLGPLKPVANPLLEDVHPGDKTLKVHDASKFPQVGTLWLDKGAVNQEQIAYRFVDYASNTIFLSSQATQTHLSSPYNFSRIFLGSGNSSSLPCLVTDGLTTPRQVLLESSIGHEVVTCTANSVTDGYITTSPLTLAHPRPSPWEANVVTLHPYATGAFTLSVNKPELFPSEGVVQITPAAGASTYSVVSGTTTSIAVSGFAANELTGYRVIFTGNITSLLADATFYVLSNTSTSITFNQNLFIAPAAGDTFKLVPTAVYTSVDYATGSLHLRRPLTNQTSLPTGSKVELLTSIPKVRECTVLVEAGGWSWSQPDDNTIYVKLPPTAPSYNILADSYVSDYPVSSPTTNTTAAYSALTPNILQVASTLSFPYTGVLRYQPSGANLKLGYYRVDSTTFYIPYPPAGMSSVANSQPVSLHMPVYSSTTVRDGDVVANALNPAKFPSWFGPYITSPGEYAVERLGGTLASNVAGTTKLLVGVSPGPGPRVLEVEDAMYAPISTSYLVQIGAELFTATATALRSVALANMAAASAGDLSITLSGHTANSAFGGAFPLGSGYRLLLGSVALEQLTEIVEVVSFNAGTGVVTLKAPLQKNHSAGDIVTLAADCITVTQVDLPHSGYISDANRVPVAVSASHFASYTKWEESADDVLFLYDKITLASAPSGWPTSGKIALGSNRTPGIRSTLSLDVSSGATDLRVSDVTVYPTAPFKLLVGTSTNNGAYYTVSSKLTGTTPHTLRLQFPLKGGRLANESVEFREEYVEVNSYKSITSTTINFDGYIYFSSSHTAGVPVSVTEDQPSPSLTNVSFPLRLPEDTKAKISFVVELVRAAGVQVIFTE